jgi:hypothetical protein
MRPGAARKPVRDRPQVIWMAWMVLFVAEGGMMGNFGSDRYAGSGLYPIQMATRREAPIRARPA